MKEKILTLLLLCIAIFSKAQSQWTGDATAISYGGKVSIGHTNPYVATRLHVKALDSSPWAILSEANANSGVTALGHDGTAGYLSVSYVDQTGSFMPLFLRTSNLVRLSILANGNVGVGTNNPLNRFDVVDSKPGDVVRLKLWNNTTNTAGTESRIDLPVWNGNSGLSIRSMGSSNAGGFNVGTYDGWMHTGQEVSYLHFSAGHAGGQNIKHMTINPNGRVGIGATQPRAKLDLGTGGGPVMVFNPGTTPTVNYSGLFHNDLIMGGWYDNGLSNAFMSIGYRDSPGRKFHIGTASSETFSGATFIPHFTVSAGGNVGIGISDPDTKLTVNGHVKCEEVTVEIIPNTGPDYVFEKDYNLLPLAALEAYISQNKHLPEVPSAKEMEANGLKLMEMNLLLLKKVEELTLHVIEQNHEIKKVSDENQALKARMSKLESKKK